MSKIKSFAEREKDFEEAHYSCRELIADQLDKVENYVSKWILAAVGVVFVFQAIGFIYFYYEIHQLRKKVDHRYFLLKESLEDIHKVRLDNGKIISDYKVMEQKVGF